MSRVRAPGLSFELLGRVPTILMMVAALGVAYVTLQVGSIVALTFQDTRVMQEYLEGASLLSVDAWRDGGLEAMYPANYNDPDVDLIITPYPPVFHALWRGMAWILQDRTYASGRIVALLAAIAVMIVVYRIARDVGSGRVAAGIFSFGILVPTPVMQWVGVARVDFPALAFALIGLWLYLRFRDGDSNAYLLCAIPFILTGLTKQSMVAAPAAVVLTELIEGRWRRSLTLSAAILGPILVLMLLANVVTGGGFFDATVSSLADEVFLMVGAALAADLVISGPFPFVLAVLAVSLWIRRDFRHRVLLMYAGTSMVVLALTIGKPGSNVNYYVEPIVALCIAGAAGLAGLSDVRRLRPLATIGFAICVVWSTVLVIQPLRYFHDAKSLMLAKSGRIELPPDPLGRPVLAPTSIVLLFEPRPDFYLNDDFTFSALAAWDKLLSPDRVTRDLRAHKIGAVIVVRSVLGPDVPQPMFVGDWQGGWNFWSVAAFREALFAAYTPSNIELPLQLMLFLPNDSTVIPPDRIPHPAQ